MQPCMYSENLIADRNLWVMDLRCKGKLTSKVFYTIRLFFPHKNVLTIVYRPIDAAFQLKTKPLQEIESDRHT